MTRHPILFPTLLLSMLHLLVDGLCACGLMLMSCLMPSDVWACVIIVLYDVLAFGTQPLTGRWVDTGGAGVGRLEWSVALLAFGALVSVLPVSVNIFVALAGAALLGMGNSLFHVYGGRYVAVVSRNDIRVMGIFVSTGAVGLATGLGFSSPVLLAVFVFALLALAALHIRHDVALTGSSSIVNTGEARQSPAIQGVGSASSAVPFLLLSCLMLVVAGRAFIGENVPSMSNSFPTMGAPLTMVMASVVIMVGKASGGFLSRIWGVRTVFCVSMLLGAATFLMCPRHHAFVLSTLLLINISMPCTLYWATKAVPGREGWVFGLLAMSLLPGYMLGQLTKNDAISQALLVPLMATIVLESFLLLCLRERRWQVLAASVVLNILTNLPLNALILAYGVISPFQVLGMESVVVVVETIGYWLVLHNWRRAFKYSVLCNIFSAIAGCIFQII